MGMNESQRKAIITQITLLKDHFQATKISIPSRIEEISLKWLRDAPFYSEFLIRFNYFITNGISTMGVNVKKGYINLYINERFMNGGNAEEGKPLIMPKIDKKTRKPVFVLDAKGNPTFDKHGDPVMEMEEWKGLNDQELEGVLIHEIMHLIRCHHERAREDAYVWNIAGDMLINHDISTMSIGNRKMVLPDGAVYLKMAQDEGYRGDPITEPVYEWLLDLRKQFQNALSDLIQNGEGGGQGQQPDCKKCGGDGKNKDDKGNETRNDCPQCKGTGKEPGQGNGKVSKSVMFDAIFDSKLMFMMFWKTMMILLSP